MCSTRACRPAAPMVLALTDTGSARTGRGVICTPAFCMAFGLGAGSGAGLAFLGGVIGTLAGLLAAYLGGKADALLMRLADLVLSFPAILVSMLILAYLGK